MFNLSITSDRGLSFSAIVAASNPGEAIKLGRAAVREAGISRAVGTIHYRAKKAN